MVRYICQVEEDVLENGEQKFDKDGNKVVIVHTVLREDNEDEVIKGIKDDIIHISQVIDPPYGVQAAALELRKENIRFIQKPDTSLLLKTIDEYPYAVLFMQNPERRFLLRAVKKSGMTLEFMKNPDDKVRVMALRQNPFAAEFISDHTDEEIDIMLNEPESLRFVKNLSARWIDRAISRKPSVIITFEKTDKLKRVRFADENDLEFWKKAISLDPYLISYLDIDEQVTILETICSSVAREHKSLPQIKTVLLEFFIRTMTEVPLGDERFYEFIKQRIENNPDIKKEVELAKLK